MDVYSVVLFLHIVGALGMFVALGLEWTGLWQMRSATTSDQIRPWMRLLRSTRGVGMASMLTILISGFYMMVKAWGATAWIAMSLGVIILGVVLTLALTGPRMAAIGRALATEKGAVSHSLRILVNHPALWISIQTRVAAALGIVFLKVVKPDLGGSLLVMGVVIVLGLVTALPLPRRERVLFH
jgi:hypothetical protein